MVKNLPATQETWVQPLGREDPLGKEMAYPLQYSCLENPMDRGVWQTTVHGILQARTLEWVSLSLLQGIFPTQGLNPGLPHCRRILHQLSHKGSPLTTEKKVIIELLKNKI